MAGPLLGPRGRGEGRDRHGGPADRLRVGALRRSPARRGRATPSRPCAGPGPSCSARPSRPSSRCTSPPGPATPWTRAGHRAGRPAGRRRRWRPAWCPSRSAPRRPGRSCAPPPTAGSTATSRRGAGASTKGIWRLSEHLDTLGLFARTRGRPPAAPTGRSRTGSHGGSSSPTARRRPTSRPRRPPCSRRGVGATATSDVRDALDRGGRAAGGRRVAGRGDGDAARLAAPARAPGKSSWRSRWRRTCTAPLGARVEPDLGAPRRIVERGDALPGQRVPRRPGGDARRRREPSGPLAAATDLRARPERAGRRAPRARVTPAIRSCAAPGRCSGCLPPTCPSPARPDGLPVGVQLVGTARDDVSYLT